MSFLYEIDLQLELFVTSRNSVRFVAGVYDGGEFRLEFGRWRLGPEEKEMKEMAEFKLNAPSHIVAANRAIP